MTSPLGSHEGARVVHIKPQDPLSLCIWRPSDKNNHLWAARSVTVWWKYYSFHTTQKKSEFPGSFPASVPLGFQISRQDHVILPARGEDRQEQINISNIRRIDLLKLAKVFGSLPY